MLGKTTKYVYKLNLKFTFGISTTKYTESVNFLRGRPLFHVDHNAKFYKDTYMHYVTKTQVILTLCRCNPVSDINCSKLPWSR